jgi:uncharacterized protein
MSQLNADVVRRGYDAWNQGDLDAVREIYSPDVVASAGELWPAAGDVHGPDAIIEQFASIFATFERLELVPEEYADHGDVIVVPTVWRGTLPGSDALIEQQLVATYRLRDGLVVHIGYFDDLESALQASGIAAS